MTDIDFAGRLSYYGMIRLEFRCSKSLYSGESETVLYNGLDLNDKSPVTTDSSKIGIQMLGLDARYTDGPMSSFSIYSCGVRKYKQPYNTFTNSDLGSVMTGYYLEGGYNLYVDKNTNDELILFIRYENYNTHDEMAEGFESNLF